MLTIDLEGAQALLDLLQRLRDDVPVTDGELDAALAANALFVDFYGQWEGGNRDTIRRIIRCFHRPEEVPPGLLPARLAEGFRQAVEQVDLLEGRTAWLREVDTSAVARRILAFLPADTPLDSTIHITLDFLNDAFVHQGQMGVSLLKGGRDRESFEDTVAHELHHVCVGYWSAQDPVRRALLEEKSGRAVAVCHVQNLLAEGMANAYCTPGNVFRSSPDEPPANPFEARQARLQREEGQFFSQAEATLAMCLAPGAEYDACRAAFEALALDLEAAMLPAGHYLGARMIQTMEQVHPRGGIVRCVQHLAQFLPLYNAAAHQQGSFLFDAELVGRFARLWDGELIPRA